MGKKILVRTLIAVVVIVAVLAAVIAMQPSTFHIERSTKIAAPPADVFAQVDDFHKWQPWSPWEKIDPAMTRSYEGTAAGTGAIYSWAGNAEVGEGSMTITESRPDELIRINLHFLKPMEGTATSEFTFKPEGDQTRVTWSMDGTNNFIGKAFCLVMSMDKMIGDKYAEGLANIKKIVEAEPQAEDVVPDDKQIRFQQNKR